MSRRRFIALSLVLDAVLVFSGYVVAFLIKFNGTLPAFNFNPFLLLSPAIVAAYLASGYVNRLYSPESTETPWDVFRVATISVVFATILTAALAFFGGARTVSFARSTLLIAFFVVLTFLVAWRLLFLRFGTIRWPEQRVVIVGLGQTAVELATELSSRGKWGFRVEGLIDPKTDPEYEPPKTVGGFPVLGKVDRTAVIAAKHKIHRVIVVSPVALRELVESLVLADEVRVRVDVVPELYEVFIGTVDTIVGDIPLMEITRSGRTNTYVGVKRVLDVVVSLLMIVLLSPIYLLAGLAILLTMGWPVVFAQERVGTGMHQFTVYKLRTMVKDAEKKSGPVLAEENDPRITPVGRVLRKLRIDELPQLFNILLGDMSFVGPRPERAFFVEQFVADIPGYRERFAVKPGVTGLEQVSGGYATTPERKLKYDLIYMYHQSLLMDVQIIGETLRVVLTGHGAR